MHLITPTNTFSRKRKSKIWPWVAIVIAVGLLIGVGPAHAQNNSAVQEIMGRLEEDEIIYYSVPKLQKGDTLYAYASNESGNLDPFVAIVDGNTNPQTLLEELSAKVAEVYAGNGDPLELLPEILEDLLLSWDDDSGAGYDVALEFKVPADGDYQLLVTAAPGNPGFGNYRLLVGVNKPAVLTGKVKPTVDSIAFLNAEASGTHKAVQEISGSLSVKKPSSFASLNEFAPGDTFYAYVESTSGNLAPVLTLRDYGGKLLRTANFQGQETSASLTYKLNEGSKNYILQLEACCEDQTLTEGDFRLVAGINAPEILTGEATQQGRTVLEKPIDVQVGVSLNQITDVDQISENFGVVVTMQMKWRDPRLAFSPDDCQCSFQTYTVTGFTELLTDLSIDDWPGFTLFNQQGRRFSQNEVITVESDGAATYLERFSATLQAPDFDLKLFPFDKQQFFIRIIAIFPEEFYRYTEEPLYSIIGNELGEEEWQIIDSSTEITTRAGRSEFVFDFEMERHLNFYIFRIFLPILLIIIVSWITFFLGDYSKRIDVTGANLLVFVAFNFTVSNELPRLGYLTFMDTILIGVFLISIVTIIMNVALKRLELAGKTKLAKRIDTVGLWAYPLTYLIGGAVVINLFFVQGI